MTILQIEHSVPSYEGWKKAFENDPIDRRKSGMKSYRIYRAVDDPNYVIIDLEFANAVDAQKTLLALKKLWNKVEGSVIVSPKIRMVNLVESNQLS